MTSSNTAFWSGEPSARGRAGFRLLPPLQEGRSLSLQAFDVLLTAVVWVRRDVVRVIARVLAVVINEAVLVLVLVVSGSIFGDVASCGGIYCEWVREWSGRDLVSVSNFQTLLFITCCYLLPPVRHKCVCVHERTWFLCVFVFLPVQGVFPAEETKFTSE